MTVVIVNYNTENYLRSCLLSIEANMDVPVEVIVIDNASDDRSVAMVRESFPNVVLVANDRNVGYATGNNQGWALARGRYVFILNPDTVVVPGCLGLLSAFLDANPDVGVVGPYIRTTDPQLDSARTLSLYQDFGPTTEPQMTEWWNNRFGRVRVPNSVGYKLLPRRSTLEPFQVGWVLNAASLIRRTAVQRTALFDTRFFIGTEEIELCCGYLKSSGWRCFMLPAAQVIHFVGRSHLSRSMWTARGHALAEAAIFWRRSEQYGPIWARLDSVVGLLDNALLWTVLGLLQLLNADESRASQQLVYRERLKTNIGLLVEGRNMAMRIDTSFRRLVGGDPPLTPPEIP